LNKFVSSATTQKNKQASNVSKGNVTQDQDQLSPMNARSGIVTIGCRISGANESYSVSSKSDATFCCQYYGNLLILAQIM